MSGFNTQKPSTAMDKNAIPKRMNSKRKSTTPKKRKKAPRVPKMIEGHNLQLGVQNISSMIGR